MLPHTNITHSYGVEPLSSGMKQMTKARISSSLFLPQKTRNVEVYTKATFHVWYLSLSNVYICLSHGHILAYQEREEFAMIMIWGPGVPVAVF